jgi:hypothetical protein
MTLRRTVRLGPAIIFAILCLAILALWLRSYHARDGLWYTTPLTRYSLHSHRGRLWFWMLTTAPGPAAPVWPTPARMHLGFVWDSMPDTWYDQFRWRSKGVDLLDDFLNAACNGGAIDRGALGFRYVRNDVWLPRAQIQAGYPTARSRALYVPHAFLALLLAAPLGAWLVRARRIATRLRQGRCPKCGYDLRASRDRCPECGNSTPRDFSSDRPTR